MNTIYSDYKTSFAVSVALHGLVLLVLFINWNLQSKMEHIDTPQYIQAHLVKMTAQSAPVKETIEKPVQKESPAPEPEIIRPLQRDVEKQELQHKLQLDKQKQEKIKQEKLNKEKILREQQEKQNREAQEKQQREELDRQIKEKAAAEKRKADEALAKELADEEVSRQSLADKQLAQSYSDMIRRRVEQNWSRPPSAQKGMEVLLEIQLVPTGYVNGVAVLRSSGNASFDQSALQAVQKAERFPEIKDVPGRVFEQYFRRFKIAFKFQDNF